MATAGPAPAGLLDPIGKAPGALTSFPFLECIRVFAAAPGGPCNPGPAQTPALAPGPRAVSFPCPSSTSLPARRDPVGCPSPASPFLDYLVTNDLLLPSIPAARCHSYTGDGMFHANTLWPQPPILLLCGLGTPTGPAL